MASTESNYKRSYESIETALVLGKIDECAALCEVLLADNELPSKYRIKVLMLLASMTEDWHHKEVGKI